LKSAFASQGNDYSYAELVSLAESAPPRLSIVDANDPRFFRPGNMPQLLQDACRETGQPIPETPGAMVRCAYESLAEKYRQVLAELEDITGEAIEVIHIVGGGSRSALLNQLTADACNRPVVAGPVESTVLGNLLIQLRTAGEISTLADIRHVVRQSFAQEMKTYLPRAPFL
jgi:rhamnulokinase